MDKYTQLTVNPHDDPVFEQIRQAAMEGNRGDFTGLSIWAIADILEMKEEINKERRQQHENALGRCRQ